MHYNIKKVSDKIGMRIDTIRYYEDCGLIRCKRDANNYRYFDEYDIRVLTDIKRYRQLGCSIEQCRQLIESVQPDDFSMVLENRLEAIEHERAKLDLQEIRLLSIREAIRQLKVNDIYRVHQDELLLYRNYYDTYEVEIDIPFFRGLIDSMPITEYYRRIPLDSIQARKPVTEYGICIYRNYAEMMNLDLSMFKVQPAGEYLCAAVRKRYEDSFDYSLLEPLLKKAEELGCVVCGDFICRYLCNETTDDGIYSYHQVLIPVHD